MLWHWHFKHSKRTSNDYDNPRTPDRQRGRRYVRHRNDEAVGTDKNRRHPAAGQSRPTRDAMAQKRSHGMDISPAASESLRQNGGIRGGTRIIPRSKTPTNSASKTNPSSPGGPTSYETAHILFPSLTTDNHRKIWHFDARSATILSVALRYYPQLLGGILGVS